MRSLFDACQRYGINIIHFKNFDELAGHLIHEIDLEVSANTSSIETSGESYIALSEDELQYLEDLREGLTEELGC